MRLGIPSIVFMLIVGAGVGALHGNASAAPQESAVVPSAASIVKARSLVSLEPVPRGKEFQVAVVADIRSGYHVNSHKPSDEYLIATTVTPQLPAGFQVLDTIYPAGRQEKFSFSPNKPLDVYTGSVTFKLRVVAQADAPIGVVNIPTILRYQACNDTTCLPPVKIPVDVRVDVGAAGSTARAMHPEIFSGAAK
jgi:Thiol:disulfide interchange protein DsbD, N-terminal